MRRNVLNTMVLMDLSYSDKKGYNKKTFEIISTILTLRNQAFKFKTKVVEELC